MTSSFFNASEIAELIFACVLFSLGVYLAARRTSQLSQSYLDVSSLAERARHAVETLRAASDGCAHPEWRVDRLPVRGEGHALKISCFRCRAPALDRFESRALADGSISIVNATPDVQLLVIAGELHEMLPQSQFSEYEDDAHESTYAVFLQPPEPPEDPCLRKL